MPIKYMFGHYMSFLEDIMKTNHAEISSFQLYPGSQTDISGQIEGYAFYLLQNCAISNLLNEYKRINTIEFYISCEAFPDGRSKGGATHERIEQKKANTFYVHTRSKSGWTMPIFNRHGIDITCGSENCYGGILLREIENPFQGCKDKEGSGRTLRALLRGDSGYETLQRGSNSAHWSEDERNILSGLNGANIFNNKMNITIKQVEARQVEIYRGPREGISKTRFASLPFRYSIHKLPLFEKV